jgi:hypothetical protein
MIKRLGGLNLLAGIILQAAESMKWVSYKLVTNSDCDEILHLQSLGIMSAGLHRKVA